MALSADLAALKAAIANLSEAERADVLCDLPLYTIQQYGMTSHAGFDKAALLAFAEEECEGWTVHEGIVGECLDDFKHFAVEGDQELDD